MPPITDINTIVIIKSVDAPNRTIHVPSVPIDISNHVPFLGISASDDRSTMIVMAPVALEAFNIPSTPASSFNTSLVILGNAD